MHFKVDACYNKNGKQSFAVQPLAKSICALEREKKQCWARGALEKKLREIITRTGADDGTARNHPSPASTTSPPLSTGSEPSAHTGPDSLPPRSSSTSSSGHSDSLPAYSSPAPSSVHSHSSSSSPSSTTSSPTLSRGHGASRCPSTTISSSANSLAMDCEYPTGDLTLYPRGHWRPLIHTQYPLRTQQVVETLLLIYTCRPCSDERQWLLARLPWDLLINVLLPLVMVDFIQLTPRGLLSLPLHGSALPPALPSSEREWMLLHIGVVSGDMDTADSCVPQPRLTRIAAAECVHGDPLRCGLCWRFVKFFGQPRSIPQKHLEVMEQMMAKLRAEPEKSASTRSQLWELEAAVAACNHYVLMCECCYDAWIRVFAWLEQNDQLLNLRHITHFADVRREVSKMDLETFVVKPGSADYAIARPPIFGVLQESSSRWILAGVVRSSDKTAPKYLADQATRIRYMDCLVALLCECSAIGLLPSMDDLGRLRPHQVERMAFLFSCAAASSAVEDRSYGGIDGDDVAEAQHDALIPNVVAALRVSTKPIALAMVSACSLTSRFSSLKRTLLLMLSLDPDTATWDMVVSNPDSRRVFLVVESLFHCDLTERADRAQRRKRDDPENTFEKQQAVASAYELLELLFSPNTLEFFEGRNPYAQLAERGAYGILAAMQTAYLLRNIRAAPRGFPQTVAIAEDADEDEDNDDGDALFYLPPPPAYDDNHAADDGDQANNQGVIEGHEEILLPAPDCRVSTTWTPPPTTLDDFRHLELGSEDWWVAIWSCSISVRYQVLRGHHRDALASAWKYFLRDENLWRAVQRRLPNPLFCLELVYFVHLPPTRKLAICNSLTTAARKSASGYIVKAYRAGAMTWSDPGLTRYVNKEAEKTQMGTTVFRSICELDARVAGFVFPCLFTLPAFKSGELQRTCLTCFTTSQRADYVLSVLESLVAPPGQE
eukprot:TRINITY_DN5083_c0_g1_i5.p1 TRINITY_DN5083_c0_g1~~TRINITY_DN5083_c0_g1_i5.p1  ORF type:complete len:947 (-),score=73.20 TRINITY_DN5083_c0_g1_i5:151-2991(-)